MLAMRDNRFYAQILAITFIFFAQVAITRGQLSQVQIIDIPIQHGINYDRTFGSSVAISQDNSTLVIGCYEGTKYGGGIVYVFTRSNTGYWEEDRTLEPSGQLSLYASYGLSVAVSSDGSVIVVGAPGQNHGEIVVWTRSGKGWVQSQVLTDSPNSGFGYSVDISTDASTIVATAEDSQAFCIYTLSNGQYIEDFCASGAGPYYYGAKPHNNYDSAVNSDGSIVAVITGNYYNTAGIVNIYAPQTSGKQKYAIIQTIHVAATLCTTLALSKDGSTLVIAGSKYVTRSATGGIFYYYRNSSRSNFELMASINQSTYEGNAMSISDDGSFLMVGNAAKASAALYRLEPHSKTMKLLSTYLPDSDDYTFGFSVSISATGEMAFIGAPIFVNSPDTSGFVYYYTGDL